MAHPRLATHAGKADDLHHSPGHNSTANSTGAGVKKAGARYAIR
jgi:hypothetical protein